MKTSNIRWAMALVVCGALLVSLQPATAQEHPEHPKERLAEHPEAKAQQPRLTMAQLAQAIEDFVAADTRAKGGYFLVFDPVAKQPLALTLDRVHKERLSGLGGGVYFACADFKSTDGTAYDVDVFMQDGTDGLEPTEVHVHKVNGKPRYTWREERGVWVRDQVR